LHQRLATLVASTVLLNVVIAAALDVPLV